MRDSPRLPLLSITKKVGEGPLRGADILYPTGHYNAQGGEIVAEIGKSSARAAALYHYPWERKVQRGFFRGNPNSHSRSRYALAHLVKEGPAEFGRLLDVGLTWYEPKHDWFSSLYDQGGGKGWHGKCVPLAVSARVPESDCVVQQSSTVPARGALFFRCAFVQ